MTPAELALKTLREASLEELVTSKHFFGLTTASPVQRAFCRVADGAPLGSLADDGAVQVMLGGSVDVPATKPREVSWLAAIRCAKSLTAAAGCVRMSQTCELPDWLKPGDIPRIPILSLDLDKAQAVMNHLSLTLQASPLLGMLVMKGVVSESDGLALRHPSGRPIVIKVVAGKRAGNAVVAYWLGGCIFDEYGKMHGQDDAVVNWDETRSVALDRILPGGQVWNIGSPWAPEGPAHKQWETSFGKPSSDLVVMNSDGPTTNPVWWTPERYERARLKNPAFRTDVQAKFGTPEEAFYSSELVRGSERKDVLYLPPMRGASYAAFIDPATRGNAFTLIIVTRVGERAVIALAAEWVGSKDVPLDTGIVLREIAQACAPYSVHGATTDQYMGDALASQARTLRDERGRQMPEFTLEQWTLTEKEKLERALCFRTKLSKGEIELCLVTTRRMGVAETTSNLALDMQRVRKKLTQAAASVHLPLTSDGRHCDFAPPMLMAMGAYLDDVKPEDEGDLMSPAERRAIESRERRYVRGEES